MADVKNRLVCAVLITYHPLSDVLRNVELLRNQIEHVIVVDNTPESLHSGTIETLGRLIGLTLIRNGKNLGIAAALNIGIRHAISKGFLWIITLDQDSQIRDDYVESMLSAYSKASAYTKVGIVCPRYEDARSGVLLRTHNSSNKDILTCITSGSLMHSEIFVTFGPMEEDLFMDYIDIEYCLRIRTAGLKIIESPESVLIHSLGHMTRHRFFGYTFSTTNHSPKRRYYITRNRILLMRRYFFKDTRWTRFELLAFLKEIVKILTVEQDRFLKARHMAFAIYDAALGRLGQRVPL